jgi:hypothetical protein
MERIEREREQSRQPNLTGPVRSALSPPMLHAGTYLVLLVEPAATASEH